MIGVVIFVLFFFALDFGLPHGSFCSKINSKCLVSVIEIVEIKYSESMRRRKGNRFTSLECQLGC